MRGRGKRGERSAEGGWGWKHELNWIWMRNRGEGCKVAGTVDRM